jgi:hypothetical protein
VREGGGIYVESSAHPVGVNLILWGNTGLGTTGQYYISTGTFEATYSCVQGGFIGTGNIQADPAFTGGPEGNLYLSQIAAGQTVQSPCVDAGDPSSAMVVGTTRTDGVQDSGVVDMGWHYEIFAQTPAVAIALTPFNPPIQIPATGGAFQYTIRVTNQETVALPVSAWCDVTLPNGSHYGPVLGPVSITLPAGLSIERQRSQTVPGGAPTGSYTFNGYAAAAGDTAMDSFPFTKLGTLNVAEPFDWKSEGDPFVRDPEALLLQECFALLNHPNPCNPLTFIRFTLPQTERVTLDVFDVQGRRIAVLVDGWREAGEHEVLFDGTNLSSGVYLYALKAGTQSAVGKLMLMK